MYLVRLWLFIILAFMAATSFAMPKEIVIIRHGEKPPHGNSLDCQGLNRALTLSTTLSKFGNFQQIYVPHLDALLDATSHTRMLQTASPYAISHNVEINSRYADSDAVGATSSVQQESGDVLMVWDHGKIGKLAAAFGVHKYPKWHADDFDSVWIITYSGNAQHTANLTIKQENINPSTSCKWQL